MQHLRPAAANNDCVGLWEHQDGTKDEYGQEVYFKGFPSKDDYPEKDSWRDEEEYKRQQMRWHDMWGTER